MEAMDEMFIPYKDMFEPPTRSIHVHAKPQKSWKFDWKIILAILIVVGIGVALKIVIKPSELRREPEQPRVEHIIRQEVKPQVKVPLVSTAPLVSTVPKVIEFKNPQDLARGVGTELRDVLLKHKQIPSLAVAGIVSNAVRTLLGEEERPEPLKEEPKVELQKVEVKIEPKIDTEPKEREEQEPPKKGKINADTDPALLKLLRDRGMTN